MKSDTKPADKAYKVSSASAKRPRTVSFTVPTLPRQAMGEWLRPLGEQRWPAAVVVIGFVAVALFSGFVGAWAEGHGQNGILSASVSNEKKVVTSQSQLISQIASTVGPSVVSVNVNIDSSTGSADGGFGLFGFSQPEQEQAAGTGIIISGSGIIITNRHVVPDGTTSVSVTLSDGTELK